MGHQADSDQDGNLTNFTIVIGDTGVPLNLRSLTARVDAAVAAGRLHLSVDQLPDWKQ